MKVEIRSDNEAIITGYVNAVERESRVLCDNRGDYVETVAAGTFAKALEENPDVRLYFDHYRDCGGQADGNLKLREDNIGLFAEATVTDPEIIQKARNNQLRGWSFAFMTDPEKCVWGKREDGMDTRRLTDIYLFEVSILDVTPAYIATSIDMRDGKQCSRSYHANDDNVEIIETTEKRSKEQEEQKDNGQSETDMSIFYAKQKLELLKLKGGN